ncbi:MAG TPA: sigma-70 family RNA polymerase sigma factor [Polyangiaceae bacterium]
MTDERPSGARAVQTGRDPALRLRDLVDANFDFIWRSLRRLGVSAVDSDDGAQRVFVVASRRLEDIEVGRERAFLFSTASLVAREMRRASARRPETLHETADGHEIADSAPDPEQCADRKQARALLDGVLDALPMDARTVFVLFEMEELKVPEIAALLEVPVGTVASRLRRARELFRAGTARLKARAEFRGGTP